jgi:hypothetical protein
MKSIEIILFFTLIFIIGACSTKKKVMVAQKETVTTTKADFGVEGIISIPGDWTLSSENKLTNQKFFRNKDSVLIAITRNPMEKFSFYSPGMADTLFTQSFYEWESKHFERQGFTVSIVEKHRNNEYIIWSVKGKENLDATLLYGGKKNFGYALSLLEPRTFTMNQRKAFLIQLFRDN